MEYIIIERFHMTDNNIWYDFSNIPQEKYYVTICALPFKTDRKALNRAKKINPNYEYIIKDRA